CTSNKNITGQKIQLSTSPETINTRLQIEFIKGKSFNHPSFAVWIEDLEGNYIETLFVTQYVGSGKFAHGEIESGKWKNEPDYVRRPASLPYWAHKRNIQAPDGLYVPSAETPVADAITGATPQTDFILNTGTKVESNKKFRVLLEINQPWDSNKFWTNNKFPNDKDYFTSLQPALVHAATIDLSSSEKEYFLNPIGHSHPSGKNGKLYTNLTTITTAKNIAESIVVRIK
ncbi:DUF2271 domain-containing protein, partial [Draconibacterium sp.]|nr:DUF2271 domain-containing protein [Draconibacterium sp.]